MPKTTFSSGTPVASQWLNAIQNLNFLGDDVDGSYPPIADTFLSSAPGSVKPEWQGFRDALKVTATTGRTITYQGGSVTLESGLIATIAPGTIVLPDNAVTFVFINNSGVATTSTTLPSRWFPLAQVTVVGGNVTAIADLRERFKVSPIARAVSTFGGGGYQGDLTINDTQSLGGLQYVRDFVVGNTGIVNVTGFLYIKASGNVTIGGQMNCLAIASGSLGVFTYFNAGYQYFGESGSGLGRSGGHNAIATPQPYPYQASQGIGSGGSTGYTAMPPNSGGFITTSRGGAGGGAIWIEAGGTITITGTINCDGTNATTPVIGSLDVAGADIVSSGASAGTGGTIWLSSLVGINVNASGILSARGGDSSIGVRANGIRGLSGAGGPSGGYLVFFAPSINVNATAQLRVNGGIGGAAIPNAGGGVIGSTPGPSFAAKGGRSFVASAIAGENGEAGQILQYNFTPV